MVIHSKRWVLMATILFFPMVTSLLRKALPGQPSYIEPASSFVVCIGVLLVIRKIGTIPSAISFPLLLWGWMQVLYACLSIFYAWQVGAVAMVTRVIPMFACFIGYATVKTHTDFGKMANFALLVSLILFPIGVAVAMFGNGILPDLLRPLKKLSELGLDVSKDQFHAFAGIFSTQTHLAYAMYLSATLGLISILSSCGSIKQKVFWWSGVFASILLSYLATRRAVFLSTMVVSGRSFLLFGKKALFVGPVCAVMMIISVHWFDSNSEIVSTKITSRSEVLFNVDLKARLQELFLGETMRFTYQWPLGSCLGCAGPEAQVFGVQISYTELGSQLILGEMGVLGLAVFLFAVIKPTTYMLKRAKQANTKKVLKVIAAYQLFFILLFLGKSAKIMSQVSSAQIFFWASYGIGAALLQNESYNQKTKSQATTSRHDGPSHQSGYAGANNAL